MKRIRDILILLIISFVIMIPENDYRSAVFTSGTGVIIKAESECEYYASKNNDVITETDADIESAELNTKTDADIDNEELNSPTDANKDNKKYKKGIKQYFINNWKIIIPILAVIFLLLILIIFIIIKYKKSALPHKKSDLIEIKNRTSDEKGIALFLCFKRNDKVIKELAIKINGSIILGRSDLSDIFIDDAAMSRQHFAIEYLDGDFFIQDLDTTNGTMLNGDKLKHKRRIESGDKITAGSLEIVVRW